MTIHVSLHHKTTYRYDRVIQLGPQIIRLRPAPHSRIPVLSYSMRVKPEKHFINWQQDPQGNYLARLVFPEKTDIFQVEVNLVADMTVINPFDFFLEPSAETIPFAYDPALAHELKPYLEVTRQEPRFHSFLKPFTTLTKTTIDFLVALNQSVQKEIAYVIRMEPGVQSPEETLVKKTGSCRDSAWLLVKLLRHLGLASRFVSGYLIQLTADVKSLDGPSGTESDFTDLHAWAEVYLPGAGWIGLDPTSGLLTGENHLPLVATPAPSSAAPISGMVDPCEVEFKHHMTITRIHEDPRVTKPYTENEWTQIDLIGKNVDQRLKQNNVRLTMGGEPTFVSIDDMEGAEWNTAAIGEHKLKLSCDLMKRLKSRWSQGALIHTGLGKWYPGEPLPRWALGCFWRKDGIALWQNERLLADDSRSVSLTYKDARKFLEHMAGHLRVEPEHIIPGYEDTWYYLWKAKRLPVNVDPLQSELKNELERKRLARIFEESLGEVIGYALPLMALEQGQASGTWQSCQWTFTGDHMFLVPGDSPMGLRLPLDSLPFARPEDHIPVFERDPTQNLDPLPHIQSPPPPVSRKTTSFHTAKSSPPAKGTSARHIIRTALCTEVRQGRMHIFMPPVSTLEAYLQLVSAIEKTASEMDIPVVIEGYEPPQDARLQYFKITPDPGVIEVNVYPVKTWEELVEQTQSLYEEAYHARLTAQKFMLDGKHTGTGGGNHFVLGGATPLESPFLRRPDLLASMVAYWNNHPSLSYLFSSLFIGPTSQAPRVDECRSDHVYELEIAMKQVKALTSKSAPCPPWLIDRLFRHLLVDGTGNTHRSEFCIDKLYSPDSYTGRLGLLELRGFEMPPHERMSIVQQLLIRSLVSWFWEHPYEEPLVRWHTALHDRFMLPFFITLDFEDILKNLQRFGIPLLIKYFQPHIEFRYPVMGKVSYKGIELELRTAVEPWYVLGEEPQGGSTSRFVDSSLERLQVCVKGLTGNRYIVTCNRRKIPLHQTGTEGEWIAGVRYRAWQPPSCLHPTIPVHAPLTFDIVDTWSGRSIGGCVYHVAHPGGRNYDTFPVNAFEAEARRSARFFKIGHTPGLIDPLPTVEQNPNFPFTLDLRK